MLGVQTERDILPVELSHVHLDNYKCSMFGLNHLATFDGAMYSFAGSAQYLFVQLHHLQASILVFCVEACRNETMSFNC